MEPSSPNPFSRRRRGEKPIRIKSRFDACVDNIIEQVRNTPNNWVWSYHKSPEDLRANREKAIILVLTSI